MLDRKHVHVPLGMSGPIDVSHFFFFAAMASQGSLAEKFFSLDFFLTASLLSLGTMRLRQDAWCKAEVKGCDHVYLWGKGRFSDESTVRVQYEYS